MKQYNNITRVRISSDVAFTYLDFSSREDSLDGFIKGYDIKCNLGLDEDTNNLPVLDLPISITNNHDEEVIFIDLRKYKKNTANGTTISDLTINSIDKDVMLLLAKMLVTFDDVHKLNNVKSPLVKSLTLFLYSIVERLFLLNIVDKTYVLPAVAAYVIHMLDNKATTETVHYVLKKEKLLIDDNEDVMELIDQRKKYPTDINGFVDYLKKADVTNKLSRLNVDILESNLATSTMGIVNKQLSLMILEHPIPWMVLLHVHQNNGMLKKTSLTSNIHHNKRTTEYNKVTELMDKVL